MRLAVAISLLLLIASGSAAQTRPADVQSLIDQLAEPDPVVRQQAAEQIIALGADARPGLLEAMESDNPEIRSRAGELLQQLPWFRQNDPPEVKKILEQYGGMEEAKRFIAMRQLADLPNALGFDAQMRLIDEETSQRLRWLAVGSIRETSMYGPNKARLRELDLTGASSARILLAGWGWMYVDMRKCFDLFDRAAQVEREGPRHPNIEIQYALGMMADDAIARSEYAKAAELIRRKIHFMNAEEDPAGDPRLELLDLHARYGPLPGFAQDFRTYVSELQGRRELLYVPAGLMRRWSPPAGESMAVAVRSLASPSPEARFPTADFLVVRDWNDWGMAEYQAIRDSEKGPDAERLDIVALERMANVSAAGKHHAEAAQYYEDLIQRISESDGLLMNRGRDQGMVVFKGIEATIEWHRLLAAKAKSDAAGVEKHLAALVKLAPTDIDIVIDVVPMLKQAGRDKEAADMFEPAYTKIKSMLDKQPSNPEHQNNLAWLCARCDERLDEALELSTLAIQECPENFAYLDTAAEANFRKGNAAKAIELEELALTFRPKDAFMIDQLERFRKGN